MTAANNPPHQGAEITAQRYTKQPTTYWGIRHVIYSLATLLGASVLATIITMVIVLAPMIASGDFDVINASNPEELTALLLSNPVGLILNMFPMYIVWASFALFVSFKRSGVMSRKLKNGWSAFKANFWLRKTKWYDIFLGLGIAAFFIGFQLLVLNILIPTLFPNFDVESASNTGVFEALNDTALIIIGLGIISLLGPIMEEVFFRGFMSRAILNNFGKRFKNRNIVGDPANTWLHRHRVMFTAVTTAIIFGCFHFSGDFSNPGAFIVVFITGALGFGLSILTFKTGRLAPAIYGHIFHNLFGVLILFAGRFWS